MNTKMTFHLILDSYMMSFSHSALSGIRKTELFPGFSQIAGLIINCMGFDHKDYINKEKVNKNLKYISFFKKNKINTILDFQTARMTKNYFSYFSEVKNEKYKFYDYTPPPEPTVIIEKEYISSNEGVNLLIELEGFEDKFIKDSFKNPHRSPFIGRKCCIPDRPIYETSYINTPIEEILNNYLDSEKEYLFECDEYFYSKIKDLEIVKNFIAINKVKSDIRNSKTDSIGGIRYVFQGTLIKDK